MGKMGNSIGAVVDDVLLVTDDRSLGAGLRAILNGLGISRITKAADAEDAMEASMGGIDAAFISASMPDRVALRLVRMMSQLQPVPLLIVVSEGPHPDLFNLARAGAQVHLVWPANPDQVRSCLETRVEWPRGLETVVRFLVGRVGLRDAQSLLRRTMLQDALALSRGSRRAAARILGVTRPAVQRMLREDFGDSAVPESVDESPAIHEHPPLNTGSRDCPKPGLKRRPRSSPASSPGGSRTAAELPVERSSSTRTEAGAQGEPRVAAR
jgi:DNA-binding NtrC family response regulator